MSADRGFDDSEAQRIIRRATEIEVRGGPHLDAKALREIAAEAGISPAAVDQAIREQLEPAAPKRSWAWRYRGLLVAVAVVAGILLSRLFP